MPVLHCTGTKGERGKQGRLRERAHWDPMGGYHEVWVWGHFHIKHGWSEHRLRTASHRGSLHRQQQAELKAPAGLWGA